MNKAQLIESIASKVEGSTKAEAERYLNAFVTSVEEALESGDKVQLVGFGTFEVRERAARQGRNPQNPSEIIDIPAKNAPVFKAGKGLKEIVNA